MGRPRIIQTIGDDGIVVVPHGIAGAAPFFVPGDSRLSAQEVVEFIARHPHARITLFADNLAQDYKSDQLPRLNIFDRAKLTRRRLRQHFPAARLASSLRQKADRTLMLGLHESSPVFHWAERLRARSPDIALLPVEGVRVARALMPQAAQGWAMLLSRHKSGGFRQIVTQNGELVFTRLTPLPDTRGGEDEAVARDIKASLDYLGRHGLRHAQDLSVLILLPGDIHLSPAFEKLPVGSLHSLAPHLAARQLGLPFAPGEEDSAADLLFAASLVANPRPVLSLMLPDARRARRTARIRSFGRTAAALALIAALALTGRQAKDCFDAVLQTRETAAQLDHTQRELNRLQADAVPLTEPLGRLRQAVARQHIFAAPVAMPWRVFNALAGVLGEDAKITRIEWKKPDDAAPESVIIALRIAKKPGAEGDTGRADIVAAFSHATHSIARALPDYDIAAAEPPYPALPQDRVTPEASAAQSEPVGTLTLQRKTP